MHIDSRFSWAWISAVALLLLSPARAEMAPVVASNATSASNAPADSGGL